MSAARLPSCERRSSGTRRKQRRAHNPIRRERAMSNLRLVLTLLVVTLAGCTVGPDYKRPQSELPAAWPVSAGDADVSARWWTLYADAQLNLMVEEALGHNTNLRLAAARVDEARAGLTV